MKPHYLSFQSQLVLLCLGLGPSVAHCQYEVSWYSIDGGGATLSTGSGYELGGTVGQPDAGDLSGGAYELTGGFWFGISGFTCTTVSDCRLDPADNACNCATCTAGTCQFTCTVFGNANCSGPVTLDDILCILAGFGTFASCPNGDIAPCGGSGSITLDDILAVLNAFGGGNPCGCLLAGVPPLCGSSSP